MKPADIDRVFGRGRLRMVTGDHVEVFREQAMPGERRRYTKRFLATAAGDFSEWTEREWRILARLVGHGIKPVPDVVRFDRGAADRAGLVQTYDAGVTVDHWATLLPLQRDGSTLRNVFEDSAHWWALARHSLVALDAIHELQLVHLDLKADNVCIPLGPADFDPHAPGQVLQPRFEEIALIDFAFSLVSGERLDSALPIARQADYEYQSPRLLQALDAGRQGDLAPTRLLDWRCDLFSLAAMLWRYLPELEDTTTGAWTRPRHARARALVRRLIEAHDAELPAKRPHADLIEFADEALAQPALRESLQRGWTLAVETSLAAAVSPTPVTRIAPLPATAPIATLARATAAAAIAQAKSAAATTPTPITRPAAPFAATPSAAAPLHTAPLPAATLLEATSPTTTSPAAAPPLDLHAGTDDVAASDAGAESLAVDPTDVAMRLGARRRDREQRAHRLAWAGGIAAVAVLGIAAAAWLESASLRLPSARDLDVALAPKGAHAPRTSPTLPAPTVVPTPSAMEPPLSAAIEAPASSPHDVGDASRAAAAPPAPMIAHTLDPAPSPTTPADVPAVVPEKHPSATPPAPATATARATTAPTVTAPQQPLHSARSRAREAAPARTTLARSARPVMPFPASSRARSSAAPLVASARPGSAHSARVATAATMRRPSGARSGPANGSTIPWAVAGRGTPRALLVTQAGAGERGALQPSAAALASIAATTKQPSAGAVEATAAKSPADTAPAPTALAVLARPSLAGDVAAPPATPIAATAFTGGDGAAVDYGARASELMTQQLPRVAQRAERLVARVLFVAGRSERVRGDEQIRAAAEALTRDGVALEGVPLAPRESQRLGDAARAEYGRRGGSAEALALQARAFGANPLDAEAAGNLAFLLLRQRPPQAEAARQLALHALTLRGASAGGRLEDWASFAIASALAGRERDASNAFLVVLALAPNVDQQCRAALDVYAIYGERLRAPIESMLRSASASARANGASSCDWPPRWS